MKVFGRLLAFISQFAQVCDAVLPNKSFLFKLFRYTQLREVEKQPAAKKIRKMNRVFKTMTNGEAKCAIGFFEEEYKRRFN